MLHSSTFKINKNPEPNINLLSSSEYRSIIYETRVQQVTCDLFFFITCQWSWRRNASRFTLRRNGIYSEVPERCFSLKIGPGTTFQPVRLNLTPAGGRREIDLNSGSLSLIPEGLETIITHLRRAG